jgi:glycosidase
LARNFRNEMVASIAFFVFFSTIFSYAFPARALPDAERDGIEAVKKWAKEYTAQGEEDFLKAELPREKSPDFWGEQIVYQIQVDRFNNGDSSNDISNLSLNQEHEVKTGNLYGILDYRHGGDLRGIIQRLDYLKDLGVTSLWLTPVFKHNGSYHGYCTSDFTEIDPGFGTKEDLRELSKEAHRRGLKVVLDLVVNHMCDAQTYYKKEADHYRCSNDLNASNWNGSPSGSPGQGELSFSSRFFPPLKSQYFFNRCGPNSQSDMEGTGPASIYGDFVATMFDLDTRNHDLQEIFTNLHEYWIGYADIDGFRLDAAKHISEDFVAYFSTHIRAYARSIGKNNFLIVGEIAGPSDWIGRRLGKMFSNPNNPNEHGDVPKTLTDRLGTLKSLYLANPVAPYPGLTAVFEFAHGGTARDVLLGLRSPKSLEAHFTSTYFNDIASQNDYRLSWNLLEIHDWPRFSSVYKTSQEKTILGLGYLAFSEGTPIIYYGMEQGLNGDCHFDKMEVGNAIQKVQSDCLGSSHALYRQDMFMGGMTRLGSTVPQINQLAYIGLPLTKESPRWEDDPYLNRSHKVYQSTQRFLQIKKSCNALKYGKTKFRWVDNNSEGILAFSRLDEASRDEVLIVLNSAGLSHGIPEMAVKDSAKGEKWVNLLNTAEQAWTTGNGSLTFGPLTIRPQSVMVFVPEKNVSLRDEEHGFAICK